MISIRILSTFKKKQVREIRLSSKEEWTDFVDASNVERNGLRNYVLNGLEQPTVRFETTIERSPDIRNTPSSINFSRSFSGTINLSSLNLEAIHELTGFSFGVDEPVTASHVIQERMLEMTRERELNSLRESYNQLVRRLELEYARTPIQVIGSPDVVADFLKRGADNDAD